MCVVAQTKKPSHSGSGCWRKLENKNAYVYFTVVAAGSVCQVVEVKTDIVFTLMLETGAAADWRSLPSSDHEEELQQCIFLCGSWF